MRADQAVQRVESGRAAVGHPGKRRERRSKPARTRVAEGEALLLAGECMPYGIIERMRSAFFLLRRSFPHRPLLD